MMLLQSGSIRSAFPSLSLSIPSGTPIPSTQLKPTPEPEPSFQVSFSGVLAALDGFDP
jgi:hypothetical protein